MEITKDHFLKDFTNDKKASVFETLHLNVIGPIGLVNIDVEAPDIDHVWTWMKKNGYLDCIEAVSGKKLRIDSSAVLGLVERDTSNLAKVRSTIIPPGAMNGPRQ